MRYMEAEHVGYELGDGAQKKPRVFRNSLGEKKSHTLKPRSKYEANKQTKMLMILKND